MTCSIGSPSLNAKVAPPLRKLWPENRSGALPPIAPSRPFRWRTNTPWVSGTAARRLPLV